MQTYDIGVLKVCGITFLGGDLELNGLFLCGFVVEFEIMT
jgi:hypothetical protein